MRKAITTDQAPAAIGCYSPAVQAGDFIFLSGQIPLDPRTQNIVSGGIAAEVIQVFENMQAMAVASGATLDDVVKLNVYLLDLADVALVNASMAHYFKAPYPARTTLGVSALPKGAKVEIEAVIQLPTTVPAR